MSSSLASVVSLNPRTPSPSKTGVNDWRTAAETALVATTGEVAQQRVLQKAKIKALMERQEKHQAGLLKAYADDEKLKYQMATSQSKYDARLAELLKQQQCGGDVMLWQKKKKKKRQKQKKKEHQQRRQQDDHLTSDEDEEEEELEGEKEAEVEKDDVGNWDGVIEATVGKEEFEVSKKAKVKAILLLKLEQKEYTIKAKKAKDSLAELERQWRKEDEERVMAWMIEDDERIMKEQKSVKCKKEPDTYDIVTSNVNLIKSTRKKRKAGDIIDDEEKLEEKEVEKKMDDNDKDVMGMGSNEVSINSELVFSFLSIDSEHSTINSTTVGKINDNDGGTCDGGEKINKKQLENERKTEELKRKDNEVDDLNHKKNRMTWLLKEIIKAQTKMKIKTKMKG